MSSSCAACKIQRRKCVADCIFAPYFPGDKAEKFQSVQRVFGASNVSKLLQELPPESREDAANSLVYEAEARLRDPVYGCVGYISILQHHLRTLQSDLRSCQAELATFAVLPALPPDAAPGQPVANPYVAPPPVRIFDPSLVQNRGKGFSINSELAQHQYFQQQYMEEMTGIELEQQNFYQAQELMRLQNTNNNNFNDMVGSSELALVDGTYGGTTSYHINVQQQYQQMGFLGQLDGVGESKNVGN